MKYGTCLIRSAIKVELVLCSILLDHEIGVVIIVLQLAIKMSQYGVNKC